jgi:DNA-nicking Smr family endonuclease
VPPSPKSPHKIDFGDILDAWEKQTATAQYHKSKKSTPKPPPQPPQKVDPITAWIRIHGVYDKDKEAEEMEASSAERRHRLMHTQPDARLDLHGLNRHQAWKELENFFEDSRRRGCEKVLIIHGKGDNSGEDSVLKQVTRRFIEVCPYAGESGHANARQGGTGVLWVLLKKTNTEDI